MNKLAVALYTRVPSPSRLHQVLSQLGHSTNVQVLKFKIGIYQMVISGLGLPTSGEVQKPQPRIRPPAKELPDHRDLNREFQPATRPSISSTLEVLRLVETRTPKNVAEHGSLIPLVYKFQLLLTYGTLQIRLGPQDRNGLKQSLRFSLASIVRFSGRRGLRQACINSCLRVRLLAGDKL